MYINKRTMCLIHFHYSFKSFDNAYIATRSQSEKGGQITLLNTTQLYSVYYCARNRN